MRKIAIQALQYTHFTPATHPALCALIDYAAQRPGIDPQIYGDWPSYQSDARMVSRQWKKIVELLRIASYFEVTDAAIVATAEWAYSGRYHWDGQTWDYCAGQYFCTEYRAGVVAILKNAIPREARR